MLGNIDAYLGKKAEKTRLRGGGALLSLSHLRICQEIRMRSLLCNGSGLPGTQPGDLCVYF